MVLRNLIHQNVGGLTSPFAQSGLHVLVKNRRLRSIRMFSCSICAPNKHKDLPGYNEEHQGAMSRTDKEVVIQHPPESKLPQSVPYQGRGGVHSKRTLASFSLEDRVAVVTGGARGLGLIMAQAIIISGANVALVDLNSACPRLSVGKVMLTCDQ